MSQRNQLTRDQEILIKEIIAELDKVSTITGTLEERGQMCLARVMAIEILQARLNSSRIDDVKADYA